MGFPLVEDQEEAPKPPPQLLSYERNARPQPWQPEDVGKCLDLRFPKLTLAGEEEDDSDTSGDELQKVPEFSSIPEFSDRFHGKSSGEQTCIPDPSVDKLITVQDFNFSILQGR